MRRGDFQRRVRGRCPKGPSGEGEQTSLGPTERLNEGSDHRSCSTARLLRALRVTLSSPTTFIGSVSAAIAFAAFLAYVYGLRRSNQAAARDEALALADTRGQMIAELRRRVAALERGQKQARTHYRRNLHELEDALEQARREAREQAYQTVATARFTIHVDGSVEVELVKATPWPRLNQLLLETLRRWRFFPALRDGRPIESTQEIRVHFNVS